jgi:hypothetical protein
MTFLPDDLLILPKYTATREDLVTAQQAFSQPSTSRTNNCDLIKMAYERGITGILLIHKSQPLVEYHYAPAGFCQRIEEPVGMYTQGSSSSVLSVLREMIEIGCGNDSVGIYENPETQTMAVFNLATELIADCSHSGSIFEKRPYTTLAFSRLLSESDISKTLVLSHNR